MSASRAASIVCGFAACLLLLFSCGGQPGQTTADLNHASGQAAKKVTIGGQHGRVARPRLPGRTASAWDDPDTLDPAGDEVSSAMIMVDGTPAIAFVSSPDDGLFFQRASDPYGETWGAPVTVDDGHSSYGGARSLSMAIVNGKPAIALSSAYWNGTGFDYYVRYVQADSVDGSTWGNAPVTLDTQFIWDISLQDVNGRPAVAYSTYDLWYIRANKANGTAWPSPHLVGYNASVGVTMTMVGGNPAVVVAGTDGSGNPDLYYIQAQNASGSAWNSQEVVLSGLAGVTEFTPYALTEIGGEPAIAFSQYGQGLRYIYGLDPAGSSWDSPITLDANGGGGSMAIVDGNPAVSYVDASNYTLRYIRANSGDGSTWGGSVLLSGDPYILYKTILSVVSGNPAVVYFHWNSLTNVNSTLRYMRATDPDGEKGWATNVTGSLGLATTMPAKYTSVAMIGGKPAIAYCAYSSFPKLQALYFVLAQDDSGSSWNSPVLVDNDHTQIGLYPSLAEVGGYPAISYQNYTSGRLVYSRATDANGTSWPVHETFGYDNPDVVGAYSSLAVVGGYPAISYYNQTRQQLEYERATNASGTTFGPPHTVDSTNDVGKFSSLMVVNSNPAISYYDATSGNLKYARAYDSVGDNTNSWTNALNYWPCTPDHSSNDVGRDCTLVVADGQPAVGYFDQTNSALYYVRASDAYGITWGTPQPLVGSGVAAGACMAIINDGTHDVPTLSYQTSSSYDLCFIQATNPSGSTWGSAQVLDNTGTVIDGGSLCQVVGGPGIAYLDMSDYTLRYAYGF